MQKKLFKVSGKVGSWLTCWSLHLYSVMVQMPFHVTWIIFIKVLLDALLVPVFGQLF